jgi:hypothetical protein
MEVKVEKERKNRKKDGWKEGETEEKNENTFTVNVTDHYYCV